MAKRENRTVTSVGFGIYRIDGEGFQSTREGIEAWFARRPHFVAVWWPASAIVLL